MVLRALLVTVLKVVPLGIYARAAACKLGFPILGCDAPLCPLAIGKEATDGCTPNGNTAEVSANGLSPRSQRESCNVTRSSCVTLRLSQVKAWCEHGWTPWLNGLLTTAGVPFSVTCNEDSGFILLKVFAVLLIIGYTLLWSSPRFGALWLTVFMGFGLHFHITVMKDPPEKLVLQIALFASSLLVIILESLAPTKKAAVAKNKKE